MGLFYVLTILALAHRPRGGVTCCSPAPACTSTRRSSIAAVAAQYTNQAPPVGFAEFVLHIIPTTFFGAFAEGEVLPVLLLAILVRLWPDAHRHGRPAGRSTASTASRTCCSPPLASS